MLSKTDTKYAVIILGCFAIVLVVFTVFPLIPIADPKQCFTTPCEQTKLVDLRELITGESFLPETLTPLAPDDMPDNVGACIEIYQPVCATDGRTYSNQCFLDLAETELDHQGVC